MLKLQKHSNSQTVHIHNPDNPFQRKLHQCIRVVRTYGLLAVTLVPIACTSQSARINQLPFRSVDLRIEKEPELLKCAKLPKQQLNDILKNHKTIIEKHSLTINRKGKVRSYSKKIEKIFEAYVKFRKEEDLKHANNILIYINGGLNKKEAVQAQAAEQIPCMKKAGYFPIFLIWRTGPIETYFEQIGVVRNGYLHDKFQITAPFYFIGDIGQGIARAPATYYWAPLKTSPIISLM